MSLIQFLRKLIEFNVIDTLSLAENFLLEHQTIWMPYVEDIILISPKERNTGALLDAELLADVFLEMNGGRQKGIDLDIEKKKMSCKDV